MTTTSSGDAKMIQAFDRFKAQIDGAYIVVRNLLEEGDFVGAQAVLARIGQTHARTSLSMRNYLIKTNRLPQPKKDD